MIKKILLGLLSALLGLVFIYSGWTKLDPIEPFEFTFVDLGIANWRMAPFIARLFISAEFLIGALLILNIKTSLTNKLTIGTLVFFSIYLIGLLFLSGNKGNCGCFGTHLVMTPLQALIKNVVMIIVSFILLKFHSGIDFKNYSKYIIASLILAALSYPHIDNYVDLSYAEAYLNAPEDQFKLELDSLYKDAKVNTPPKTLSQGKHVISFMSLTCPHCRIAAKKMRIIHERNLSISIYFVLNGDDVNIKPFHEDTESKAIPWCILNGKNFVYLAAGTNMPAIFLVNNSVVEHRINYLEMDQDEIENWLRK